MEKEIRTSSNANKICMEKVASDMSLGQSLVFLVDGNMNIHYECIRIKLWSKKIRFP